MKISLGLALAFLAAGLSIAQEEDFVLRAVRIKGNVLAYHNQNDETSRLYTSQSVDDGDKVTTAADSEAVLRVGKKTYVYLAPHTKIHITRLRQGNNGFECRINLVTGRMLSQAGQPGEGSIEVSAGSVLCHEHGTLFEVSRQKDELRIVSFEGVMVANFHGTTKMAKSNEVLNLKNGKFRVKTHHLNNADQGHLQAWQDLLAEIYK